MTAQSMANGQPTMPFPLLKLAAELRNAVYKQYVTDAFLCINPIAHIHGPYYAHLPIPFFSHAKNRIQPDGLALMRVNKQVYNECSAVLYSEVEFRGHMWVHNPYLPGVNFVGPPDDIPSVYYEEKIQQNACISHYNPAFLAKFRYLNLYFWWSWNFSWSDEYLYNKIHNVICSLVHAMGAKESAANTNESGMPCHLKFCFMEPDYEYDGHANLALAFDRWTCINGFAKSFAWMFSHLKNVKVTSTVRLSDAVEILEPEDEGDMEGTVAEAANEVERVYNISMWVDDEKKDEESEGHHESHRARLKELRVMFAPAD